MSQIMPSPPMIPVFASTNLKLHPDDFAVVSLPLTEKENALELFKKIDPFSSLTIDYEEVSLILRVGDWEYIKNHFKDCQVESPYKVITFDIVLDLNLVGYLSVVSAVLAESGISIYALSTFLRDHILIKASNVDKTLKVLQALINRCKSTQ